MFHLCSYWSVISYLMVEEAHSIRHEVLLCSCLDSHIPRTLPAGLILPYTMPSFFPLFFSRCNLPPGLVYEEVLRYHRPRPGNLAAPAGSAHGSVPRLAPGPVPAAPETPAEASNRKRARDNYESPPVSSAPPVATTSGLGPRSVPGPTRGHSCDVEPMPNWEKGSGKKRRKESPDTRPPTSGSSWSSSSSGASAGPAGRPAGGPGPRSAPTATRASGSSSGQDQAPAPAASLPRPDTTDRRGAHWAMKRQGAMRRQGL